MLSQAGCVSLRVIPDQWSVDLFARRPVQRGGVATFQLGYCHAPAPLGKRWLAPTNLRRARCTTPCRYLSHGPEVLAGTA